MIDGKSHVPPVGSEAWFNVHGKSVEAGLMAEDGPPNRVFSLVGFQ